MTGLRRGVFLLSCMVAGLGLPGCGGGGGSGGPPPNRPPTASFTATPDGGPPPLTVSFDASASGDVDGSITNYAWDFGNTATGTGQTIDNTYDTSGVYEVRLTVTDDDGGEASATRELVVNVLPIARIEADPVDGQAPVTVAFDASMSHDGDGEIVSFEWDVAGAARADVTTVEHTFEEPGVYPVRLTVTDDLGGVAEAVFEVNARDDADVPYTVPYVPTARYADALRPCIYAGDAAQVDCTTERLPFLGTEFVAPSVDDVMTRVLVSHRWMGDSLRETLERLPLDLRLLTRSLTTIVIASDIRPAYYWARTGAIYLDAAFFWRTPEERAVVTMEEDFRAGFGSRMQFSIPWRYVRDNIAWNDPAAAEGPARADRLLPFIAFLLYHELSHAADFMPAAGLDEVDPAGTALDAVWAQRFAWPSSSLAAELPLRSGLMRSLGEIFFAGRTPTDAEEALLPEDVIDAFATDGAVDFYSYSTQFEDLADLHETILMSYHHDFEKDVAIVGTEGEGEERGDAVVAWGQRGRMSDPNVIERMRFVIDAMYPGDAQALHGYLTGRPAPLPMRPGETWAENVVLAGGGRFHAPPLGNAGARSAAGSRPPQLLGCLRVDGLPAELRELLGVQ